MEESVVQWTTNKKLVSKIYKSMQLDIKNKSKQQNKRAGEELVTDISLKERHAKKVWLQKIAAS